MGGDLETEDTPARAATVPTVAVRPGHLISKVIRGGWQLSGDHGQVDAARAVSDMVLLSDAGISTFDCADIYTGVEELFGRFRTELERTRGQDRLNRIRMHTKFVPDRDSLAGLSLMQVEAGIDRSLARLRLERLDLVQFHWWDYGVPGHVEAVEHLDALRLKGKINLIGVTNFDAPHLAELCDVTDVASAQVQYSLLDRRASGKFAACARERGVCLFAYGVLAGGFLTDDWLSRPDPGFEFGNRSLVKYRLIIEEFGGWALFQELLATLRTVADRHGADIPTIALKAALDSPDITAAIIGGRYADRLPRTLHALELELTDEDRAAIETVQSRARGPHGPVYGLERDMSGHHGRIMKCNLNRGDNRMASVSRVGAA